MPSQTFTHDAKADAPVDVVWSALDQATTWEGIGGVDRVFDPEIDARGRLRGFSFETMAAGRRYAGTATPYERIEAERMSWKVSNTEVRGLIVVDLAPVHDGTSVSVTIEVESAGWLSAMFFPVIAAAIGNGLPESVEDFAAGFGT